jgi:hypothetical protein
LYKWVYHSSLWSLMQLSIHEENCKENMHVSLYTWIFCKCL